MEGTRRKRIKYSSGLPKAMYCFFRGYESEGAPSFTKFAQSIGATSEDVEAWRKHGEFDRAYRECSQIRRDYLIDNGLARRFDPSLVKFLLSADDCNDASEELKISLEVTGDATEYEA